MRRKQAGMPEFIIAVVLLFAACSSEPPAGNGRAAQSGYTPQQEAAAALAAMQMSQRPPWIPQTPESAEFLYFIGMAEAAGESEARNAAIRDGFAAAAGFYGNLIQAETLDHSVFIEDLSRTIAEATTFDDKTNSYVNAVISGIQVIEFYTETYRTSNNQPGYKVWALCRVSRQKAEEDRANFAKNISERYTPLPDTRYDTMSAALHSWSAVLSALEQNPLHRAAAYHDGPDGRVGLYGYCGTRLNAIAGNAGFDSLPAAAVQWGKTYTGTIRLSSGIFPEIGAVSCRVVITGSDTPAAEYPLEKNNTFTLRIPAARLEAGNHTVQLELLLNAAAPALRQNPKGAFTLEVRPVPAEIVFDGEELSAAEQRILANGLRQGLEKAGAGIQAEIASARKNAVPGGYRFIISVISFAGEEAPPPFKGTYIRGDFSVDFARDGLTLKLEEEAFKDSSRDWVVRGAANWIRDNRGFYEGIIEKLTR
jgi:hypothetical protein